MTAAVVVLLAALALPAGAAAINEFPLPAGTNPGGITAGPDGALWFIEEGTNSIGRITTDGGASPGWHAIETTPGLDPADPAFLAAADQITLGRDGALWFTEPRENQIGRITVGANGTVTGYTAYNLSPTSPGTHPEGIDVGPDGAIWFTETGTGTVADKIGRIGVGGSPINHYSLGRVGSGLSDITAGPDGALWFTEAGIGEIGRIETDGSPITHFREGLEFSGPSGIIAGPAGSGKLWFTESVANQIGSITTGGVIQEYGPTAAEPSAITVGQDGALWFTESSVGGTDAIGRITTSGAITNHFAVTAGSEPSDITPGPDGALWFTEFLGNKIGRIDTAAPVALPPPPPPIPITPVVPLTPKPKPKAKKKRACKVPKVRGMSVKKAKKKLRSARCRARFRGKGTVVSTSPKAGKRTTKTVTVKAKKQRKRRK